MEAYVNVVTELERAAAILLAAPNLVTPEQRSSAEAVFLEFRKTREPFGLCKVRIDYAYII